MFLKGCLDAAKLIAVVATLPIPKNKHRESPRQVVDTRIRERISKVDTRIRRLEAEEHEDTNIEAD